MHRIVQGKSRQQAMRFVLGASLCMVLLGCGTQDAEVASEPAGTEIPQTAPQAPATTTETPTKLTPQFQCFWICVTRCHTVPGEHFVGYRDEIGSCNVAGDNYCRRRFNHTSAGSDWRYHC